MYPSNCVTVQPGELAFLAMFMAVWITARSVGACREVVERRAHIVTGKKPTEAEIDNMIDTGESETIFQKAILEQGRGHVSPRVPCSTVSECCLARLLDPWDI